MYSCQQQSGFTSDGLSLQEGTSVEGDFGVLSAHDLMTKPVDELKQLVQERREKKEQERAERDDRLMLRRSNGAGPSDIPESQVMTLEGHTTEVFSCCWSPAANLLASG